MIIVLKSKFIKILLIILIPIGVKAQVSDSVYTYSPERKYGFGGGCGIGGGYSILTGDLSKYQPNYGTFHIGFNFVFNRFIYDISMLIGNVDANDGYSNNELTLIKDSTNQILEFENTLGYFLLDRKKFSVYPFLGITFFSMSYFNGDDEISGPYRFGEVYGCAFDYKFSNAFGDSYMGDFILGTRLSYKNLNDYANLNVSNLNIGFYFRFMIRSYKKE